MADNVYACSGALQLDISIRASARRTNIFFCFPFSLCLCCACLHTVCLSLCRSEKQAQVCTVISFLLATDLVGEDLGYLQNRLQELTDERNDEARCTCDGELVL